MKKALLLLAVASPLLGCGKRGDPRPPLPRTPQPVGELAVAQRGDKLEMSLTTPRTSTGGERLAVLEVEFLYAPSGGDFAKVAEKIVQRAAPGERLTESLPLPTAGTTMRFSARARSRGEPSALAPVISLSVESPPPPPTALVARPQSGGITLRWTPAPLPEPTPAPIPTPSPAATPSPSPGSSPAPGTSPSPRPSPTPKPRLSGAFVYRRAASEAYSRPLTAVPVPTGNTTVDDASIRFGESRCYVVRTVLSADPLIESRDSEEVCVEFKDAFPPAAPTGVAVLARETALEVSWSPSSEEDLALYRVYRASKGVTPAPVAELPATETTFLDKTAPRGNVFYYTVTAVDKEGNESAPSKPMEAQLR